MSSSWFTSLLSVVALVLALTATQLAMAQILSNPATDQRYPGAGSGDPQAVRGGILHIGNDNKEWFAPEALANLGVHDEDDDPSTGDSTMEALPLGEGWRVVRAYLYWNTGHVKTSDGAWPDADVAAGIAADQTVRLGANGQTLDVAADAQDVYDLVALGVTQSPIPHNLRLTMRADVTAFVREHAGTDYWVSNVWNSYGPGDNGEAMWSMVVIYEDPAETRFFATGVWETYGNVGATMCSTDPNGPTCPPSEVSVTLSGLYTAPAGDVAGTASAWLMNTSPGGVELDENLLVGTTPLTSGGNPAGRIWNHSRRDFGVAVTQRLPVAASGLAQAADLDRFAIPAGAVPNGLVNGELDLTISSASPGGEAVAPRLFTMTVQVFAPEVAFSKTSVPVLANGEVDDDGVLEPGDYLRYTLFAANTGEDTADGVMVSDTLPAGLDYQPNSLAIDGIPVTDDDPRVTLTLPTLEVRVGDGADASTGGTLDIAETVTVTFVVRQPVTSAVRTFTNEARLDFHGVTVGPGVPFSAHATDRQRVPYDGIIDITDVAHPGAPLVVTLTDADLDQDSYYPDSVVVTVTNDATGETETLLLEETGASTGVFVGTLASSADPNAATTPDVLQTNPGDTYTATYEDAFNGSGQPATETDTGIVPADASAGDDRFLTSVGTALVRDTAATGVLANDSVDPAGQLTLTETTFSSATSTLDINADGTFVFTPTDAAGDVVFDYTISDGIGATGAGRTATATVTIVVNDPPALANPSMTLQPGFSGTFSLLTEILSDHGVVTADNPDDGDSDGIAQAATAVSQASDGSYGTSADLGSDGSCTVVGGDVAVVAPSLPGTYHCYVSVCEELPAADAAVCTAGAQLTVFVPGTLSAMDDAFITAVGVAVSGNVGTNDSFDPAGTLSFTAPALDETLGTLDLAADGGFTYTPAASVVGSVTFDYTASDGLDGSDSATVTITVNDPPTLVGATVNGEFGATTVLAVSDVVVDNGQVTLDDPTDGDTDGIAQAAIGVSASQGGFSSSAVLGADGTCTVTQGGEITIVAPSASSTASCWIQVCEELPINAPEVCAVAEIRVVAASEPDAIDDTYVTAVDVDLAVSDIGAGVVANDSFDPQASPSATLLSYDDTDGVLVLDADGTFEFSPASGVVGRFAANYELMDGLGRSDQATITIVVNDPPNLAEPTPFVPVGGSVTVSLLDALVTDTGEVTADEPTDGDVDGIDQGSVAVSDREDGTFDAAAPLGSDGACEVNADGDVEITGPSATGVFTCWVRVCEELPAASAEVCTVTPIVVTVIEGLMAVDDAYITAVNTPVEMTDPSQALLANDVVDAAGTKTAALATFDASLGALSVAPDGTFAFTPAQGVVGRVGFTYTLSDGLGQSDDATVEITVNDPPELAAPTVELVGGTEASIDIVGRLVLGLGQVRLDSPADGDSNGIDEGRFAVSASPDVPFAATAELGDDGSCSVNAGAIDITVPSELGVLTCYVQVCEELPAGADAVCSQTALTINVGTIDRVHASGSGCQGGSDSPLPLWTLLILAVLALPRRRRAA